MSVRESVWSNRDKHELFMVVYETRDKMAEIDDRLDALEKSVDSMTTRVSADLQSLKDQLAGAGKLTPQESARFDAVIQKLDSFDATNPPPAPPDGGVPPDGGIPPAPPAPTV